MDLSSCKPALKAFAFLFVLPLTCSVHIIVKKCPVTEMAWKARSQIVACEDPQVYHCIQNDVGKLMETCLIPYKVKPSVEGGCPWAFYSTERGSILGVVFYLCKGAGCPQKNESDYWTNELYKYPVCLHHYEKAITDVAGSIISPPYATTDITRPSNDMYEMYDVIVAIVTTAVVMTVVFIVTVLSWKYRRRLNCRKWLLSHLNHSAQENMPLPSDDEDPSSTSPLIDSGESTRSTNVQEIYLDNRSRQDKDISQKVAKKFSNNNDCLTMLHLACMEGEIDLVNHLINDSQNLPYLKGNKGCTLLLLAGSSGSVELVQCLIDYGCDMYSMDKTGQTITHKACQKGHVSVVKYLIHKDKGVLDIKDNNGLTPFHCAGYSGSIELVLYLIDNGCDVYSRSHTGLTIVHKACRKGHANLVKHLLRIYIYILNIKDNDGLTPFHCAGASGSVELVQYMIDNDCDVYSKDNAGRTIIHHACQEGHVNLVQHLINEDKCILDENDNSGLTPFHYAGFSGSVELVQYLIDNGCDVYSKDNDGRTIVHIACREGHDNVVKHLTYIDKNVLKIKDNDGWTPFHHSGFSGSLALLQYLIDNGCDVYSEDNTG